VEPIVEPILTPAARPPAAARANSALGARDVVTPTLLIVHLESALEAPGRDATFRVQHPCRALGELDHVAVVSGSLLSPALLASGLLDEADVLVLGEAADPDLLPVIEARRRRQRLTIFEVRTHLQAPPARARASERARDLLMRSMPPHLARHADGAQFASPALEARFRHLNARRAVFPSHLWEAPAPPAPRRRLAGRFVIGWGGGVAHTEDLLAAAPALRAVVERHPQVELAFMGEAAMADALAGAGGPLSSLDPARVTFVAPGGADDYAAFLSTLDVGIAPLQPTEVNRCRSDARFLEYAAHGVLAVCADQEPYRDAVRAAETGLLFHDAAALEAALERALAEPELTAAVVARAARESGETRLERTHVGARLAFYLETATQLGLRLAPSPREAFAGLEGAAAPSFAGSRYVALDDDEPSALLKAGLAARRAGRLDEARRCFEEARRAAPHAYMPELLLGEIEEDPVRAIEAFARAEQLNPRSCLAPFLMGLRLGYAGAGDQAAAPLLRARAIAPTFGAPQERLGELAEAAGRIDEACRLYEEAALQNPDYALPVTRLAQAAVREGRVDKAVGLLEQSLAGDPDLWLTNLVVGRAYLEQRRFHQARVHLRRALDEADDRASVLTELAKAEVGLGDLDAARALLQEARYDDSPQG
jgi:tetratricopeptide (TPR) repeat protein